jgi:hypothetical protein
VRNPKDIHSQYTLYGTAVYIKVTEQWHWVWEQSGGHIGDGNNSYIACA